MKRLLLPLIAALALPNAVNAKPVWVEIFKIEHPETCRNPVLGCASAWFLDVNSIVKNRSNVYLNMSTGQVDKYGKILETWDLDEESEAITIKCNEKIIVYRGKEIKVKKHELHIAKYDFACNWK